MKIQEIKAGKKDSHNFSAKTNNKTRLKIFSETAESKFSMLMKTLEHFEKRKYDEQEHVLASTPSKNARASAESPKCRIRMSVENPPPTEQVESKPQLSDNKNSFVTGLFGMSDEEDSPVEECIIPDQQNLPEETQELCTETPVGNSNLNNEILLDNILQVILFKRRTIGTPVRKKLAKIVNSLFNSGLEEEKLKILNKKYKRPKNCPPLKCP